MTDSCGQLWRQRELCPVPVQGCPQLLQLLQNGGPLVSPPAPHPFLEGSPPQLLPVQALTGRQVLLNHYLLHEFTLKKKGRTNKKNAGTMKNYHKAEAREKKKLTVCLQIPGKGFRFSYGANKIFSFPTSFEIHAFLLNK